MFLHILNEIEGKSFLELSYIALYENECIKSHELAKLDAYKEELGLKDYVHQDKAYDDVTALLSKSSIKVKRAIIIEISAMLYADKDLSKTEICWINKLANILEVKESETNRLIEWSQDLCDFIEVGLMYINSK